MQAKERDKLVVETAIRILTDAQKAVPAVAKAEGERVLDEKDKL